MRYSFGKSCTHNSGFTIIELLISIAIITIITTLVLVRYSSFDSTVILKDKAYEVALLIRESQVKAVSSYRNTVNEPDADKKFNYPYGVTFNMSSLDEYTAFVYKDTDASIIPKNIGDPEAVSIGSYKFDQSIQIKGLCYVRIGISCLEADQIDVSFRRPDAKALFYVIDNNGSPLLNSDLLTINSVRITLKSLKAESSSKGFVIEVTRFGTISIYREE